MKKIVGKKCPMQSPWIKTLEIHQNKALYRQHLKHTVTCKKEQQHGWFFNRVHTAAGGCFPSIPFSPPLSLLHQNCSHGAGQNSGVQNPHSHWTHAHLVGTKAFFLWDMHRSSLKAVCLRRMFIMQSAAFIFPSEDIIQVLPRWSQFTALMTGLLSPIILKVVWV